MTHADDNGLNLLDDLIKKAIAHGADAADALFSQSRSLSHSCRMGKLDNLERNESRDLGLRVFRGKRQALVSSTDLSPSALDDLITRALSMADSVPEDPWCGIAAADDIAHNPPELGLCDPHEPDESTLRARAESCEGAALSLPGIHNSGGGDASWGTGSVALATSNGFRGAYSSSWHSVSVSVLARGADNTMERDYDFTSARFGADLDDPADIGRSAGKRTLKRLNARKPETTSAPVVFDPRVSASLIGHMVGAISGTAIARGTSFLKDKLGQQVFARGITIVDDPHLHRGLGSKPFDAEGLANSKKILVADGVLQSWILSLSSARQLGLSSTAHAARGGVASPPAPAVSNLFMEPGTLCVKDLISDIRAGFYVTEMMGSSVNGLTGDYSRGASGFWIENGEMSYPVSEATLAGNLIDMYLNTTAADDLIFRLGANAPTLRVEGMTIAGS